MTLFPMTKNSKLNNTIPRKNNLIEYFKKVISFIKKVLSTLHLIFIGIPSIILSFWLILAWPILLSEVIESFECFVKKLDEHPVTKKFSKLVGLIFMTFLVVFSWIFGHVCIFIVKHERLVWAIQFFCWIQIGFVCGIYIQYGLYRYQLFLSGDTIN